MNNIPLPKNVRMALRLSSLIYWNSDEFENEDAYHADSKAKGYFTEVIRNENATMGVFLDPETRTLYGIVCGTNDLKDFKDDARVYSREHLGDPPGRAAVGFKDHADMLNRLWRAQVEKHWDAFDTVILGGHSLGGAVATILAADLYRSYGNKAGLQSKMMLVTAGAPRVLDGQAAAWLSSVLKGRLWRFVRSGDPVPNIPLPLRFTHTKGRILINSKSLGWAEQTSGLFTMAGGAWNLLRGGVTFATNHSSRDYLSEAIRLAHGEVDTESPSDSAYLVEAS